MDGFFGLGIAMGRYENGMDTVIVVVRKGVVIDGVYELLKVCFAKSFVIFHF
jgi:hypothetical protein